MIDIDAINEAKKILYEINLDTAAWEHFICSHSNLEMPSYRLLLHERIILENYFLSVFSSGRFQINVKKGEESTIMGRKVIIIDHTFLNKKLEEVIPK